MNAIAAMLDALNRPELYNITFENGEIFIGHASTLDAASRVDSRPRRERTSRSRRLNKLKISAQL